MLQEELLNTYENMKKGLDKAPESETPFPVLKDEKMYVVGDANETKINKHDFTIEFRLPEGTVEGKVENGSVIKEVEYKDVFVTPRQIAKVVSAVCKLLPFFRKIAEDNGDLSATDFTMEEYTLLLADYGSVFVDDMYILVASVLGIDERLIDYMTVPSVMKATSQIFTEYPEVLNEAENFFS